MADSPIASGAVVITASADQLEKGLRQSKQKLDTFGDQMQKWGEKQKNALGAQFSAALRGGLIGGFLGGSLQSLIETGVEKFTAWASGTREAEAAMARLVDELKRASAEQDKVLSKAAKWRTAMVDSSDKVTDINTNLASLSSRWNQLNDRVLAGQQRINSLNEGPFGGMGFSAIQIGRHVEGINATVTEMNKINEDMKKLVEERDALIDPTKNFELVQGITKATIALREQAATWGLSGDSAQRATFRFQGATDAMLKHFDAQVKVNKELAKTNALMPGLVFALNAAGKIAHQMSPQDLPGWSTMLGTLSQVAGALPKPVGIQDWIKGALGGPQGPAWLPMVLNAATTIAETFEKFADKGVQFAGAMERGSREAHSLIVRSQFGPESQRDNTTAAVRQLKSPLERAAERLDQINNKLGDIEQV